MSLHPNEFTIDDELVDSLLRSQTPQWGELPLCRLETSGTVNVVYRLGDDKVVRLPRTPDGGRGPRREARWMPVFARAVPLGVPAHLFLGRPTSRYPSNWSILEWVEGAAADPASVVDLHEAAGLLADFVLALRAVSTEGAPLDGNYRGFGLAAVDQGFRTWAERLPGDIDRGAVLRVWERCRQAQPWSGRPTWFHSDLRGDNLIARDGRLVGVIDWEGCSVGDPSADLLVAWWFLDAGSRETFRRLLGDAVPADEWERAKGWALHMAVLAIPYYEASNTDFVKQARRALSEVLLEVVT